MDAAIRLPAELTDFLALALACGAEDVEIHAHGVDGGLRAKLFPAEGSFAKTWTGIEGTALRLAFSDALSPLIREAGAPSQARVSVDGAEIPYGLAALKTDEGGLGFALMRAPAEALRALPGPLDEAAKFHWLAARREAREIARNCPPKPPNDARPIPRI